MNFLAAGTLSAWFPPEASEHAAGVDGAFFGLYVAAAFAVILMFGLTATFVLLFRRKSEADKGAVTGTNFIFLALWVLAAVGLGAYAFNLGFAGFLDQSVAPYRAYKVDVTARQWDFDFTYPNGFVADTLHVATGTPVQLNLHSEDVGHSLTIPALRLNQGILPDRITSAWFTADKADPSPCAATSTAARVMPTCRR